MTHPRNTDASPNPDRRAERARAEPMTVRPLRDRRYAVETEGGTYVADIEQATCTCPDHSIRGRRCKHLRRVAMEVTAGELPAPGQRRGACAVCGRRWFVPIASGGPHLCDRHAHAPGEVARDRETGELVVVVETTGCRADEYDTDEGRRVADYATNRRYGAHEPVVRAVYVDSLPAGVSSPAASRYAFPASRLSRLTGASRPDAAATDGAGGGNGAGRPAPTA